MTYGLSDEPIVDRNYWNNYKTLYPDAKEIDNSGIWNTPYFPEDPYGGIHSTTDPHPLVNPIENFSPYFSLPSPTPTISPEPTSTPTPTPIVSPTPSPFPPEAEYLGYIITIILALAVILIGFGIFAYLVKKRTNK
jgi:hypothetical protein